MHIADRPYLSPQAYLEWEARQPARHEYLDGEIHAMVGATCRHNLIALNACTALRSALRGRPCQVYVGEVKLRVAKTNAYYYPDLMVACGESHRRAGADTAIDDPILVMEVLSESTAAIDRREKLAAYRSLPTLKEYFIVSQEDQRVDLYRRQGDIGWLVIAYDPGDSLELASVELTLPLVELYAGTDVA